MPPRRTPSGALRQGAGSSRKPASKKPTGAARRNRAEPARRRIPRGRLLVFLLLAGLLAYGVWWLSQRPSPALEAVPAALSKSADEPDIAADTAAVEKPTERFEFYDILPNQRVLPSRTPDARSTARPSPPTAVPATTRWLQVGAFRDLKQADERIKQLILLNIPVQRQSGFDAQGKPLFRIVAGPFESAGQLNHARARLANDGLDAIPLSSLGDSQ